MNFQNWFFVLVYRDYILRYFVFWGFRIVYFGCTIELFIFLINYILFTVYLCSYRTHCWFWLTFFIIRCKEREGYIYYGEHCELKDEKLSWESKYIIALVVGLACALLIVLIFVHVVCRMRNRGKMSFDIPPWVIIPYINVNLLLLWQWCGWEHGCFHDEIIMCSNYDDVILMVIIPFISRQYWCTVCQCIMDLPLKRKSL